MFARKFAVTSKGISRARKLSASKTGARMETLEGRKLLTTTGSIAGTVYWDSNKNGVDDGDPGLAGATVYVDVNHSGKLDAGDKVAPVTKADGKYLIPGLAAGNYTVRVNPPAGYAPLKVGADTKVVSLLAGKASVGNNLGELKVIPGATISGTVYNDANGDGIHQTTEKGLVTTPVGLYDLNNKNALVTTATTNSLGQYTFANVKPGAYRVTALGTLRTSAPAVGYIDLKSVVSKGVYSGEIFEKTSNVLIGGSVYLDLNKDGKFEPATEAIVGALVTIKSGTVTVATAHTDKAGNFSVTSLKAGTYTISTVATTGAVFASPVGGTYTATLKPSAQTFFLFREVKPAGLPSLVGSFTGTVSTAFGSSPASFVVSSVAPTSLVGTFTIDAVGIQTTGTFTGSIDSTGKFSYSRIDSKGAKLTITGTESADGKILAGNFDYNGGFFPVSGTFSVTRQ